MVQAFLKKWWVESDFKAPNLPLALRLNRKGYYSVVLRAIVDCNYKFFDINVGWSGKVHDARVFRNSPLFSLGELGLLPGEGKNINGVQIPVHLIGDPAYPLLN